MTVADVSIPTAALKAVYTGRPSPSSASIGEVLHPGARSLPYSVSDAAVAVYDRLLADSLISCLWVGEDASWDEVSPGLRKRGPSIDPTLRSVMSSMSLSCPFPG